ncbi:Retrotransposon gag protein, partial [Corchorus olitorius]
MVILGSDLSLGVNLFFFFFFFSRTGSNRFGPTKPVRSGWLKPRLAEPQLAPRLLDEDAKAWWVSVKDRVGGPVTWENFLSEFNKEYYSKFEKGRISGEFLALKQGDMSVSDYDNKLRRLFRHMPGANEDLLCARFANGLALELQSSISSLITDTTRTVPYSHL